MSAAEIDSVLQTTTQDIASSRAALAASQDTSLIKVYLNRLAKKSTLLVIKTGNQAAVSFLAGETVVLTRLSHELEIKGKDAYTPYHYLAERLDDDEQDTLIVVLLRKLTANTGVIKAQETGSLREIYWQLRNAYIHLGDLPNTVYYTDYCLAITAKHAAADPETHQFTLIKSARIFAGLGAPYDPAQQGHAFQLYQNLIEFDRTHPTLPLKLHIEAKYTCLEICLSKKNYHDAERWLDEALVLAEQPVADNLWRTSGYTDRVVQIGNGLNALGRYPRAITFYHRIQTKLASLGLTGGLSYFHSLQGQINAELALGDYPGCRETCFELIERIEKTGLYDQPIFMAEYEQALQSTGDVFLKLKLRERAADYYTRCNQFQLLLTGDGSLDYADLLASLALAGGAKQTIASAGAAADYAWKISKAYSLRNGLAYYHLLSKLGEFYLANQTYDRARVIYDQLQKFRVTHHVEDYDDKLDWNTGLLEWNEKGLTPRTAGYFIAAVKAINTQLDRNFPDLSIQNIIDHRKLSSKYNDALCSQLMSLKDNELLTASLETDLLNKGLGLRVQHKQQNPGTGNGSFHALTLANIRSNLTSGEGLIDFVRFNVVDKTSTPRKMYGAFIIRPGRDAKFIRLFEETEVNELLYIKGDLKRSAELYEPLAHVAESDTRLYDLIWKALLPELKDLQTVYYSTTSQLSYINMAALSDKSGYLGNRFSLIELLDLSELKNIKSEKQPALNKFAFVGGLTYQMKALPPERQAEREYLAVSQQFETKTNKRSQKVVTFPELPEAVTEINWVKNFVHDNGRRVLGALMDSAAYKPSVVQLFSNQPDVIHFASHSYIFPLHYRETGQEYTVVDDPESLASEPDPLDSCGIVLSSANGRRYFPGNDMMLSGNDIASLSLTNCELAILNVCSSARGQLDPDDGILGLQRAFRMAGARYLLLSLDPVIDRNGLLFMKTFYQLLLAKEYHSIPAAFQKTVALLRASAKGGAPETWANWILIR